MTDSNPTDVMKLVLDQHEHLNDFGFGVFDRKGKSADQIQDEMAQDRAKMFEQRSLDQFEAARRWLRKFNKLKGINGRGTSYGLKHVAEHSIGYVTNGVFIAAALAEGFTIDRDGPNARFNISSLAWKPAQ